jgi:hypothetical protein
MCQLIRKCGALAFFRKLSANLKPSGVEQLKTLLFNITKHGERTKLIASGTYVDLDRSNTSTPCYYDVSVL